LDEEQTKRQEAERLRMYNLLELNLIKYRDISENTCMIVNEEVTSFSKEASRYSCYKTQPSTLCGTENEYQPQNGDGGCRR